MIARVTVLCSALAFAAPVAAQQTTTTEVVEVDVEVEEDVSPFSGVFQLDVTNAYYFRGLLQERDGVQIQPWTELYYNLYSAEDENAFLQDITVGGGTWLSFQSDRTGATQDPQWLYEADYYPLISLGFAGGVSLTTVYYFYTSPNDAFSTVQELNFKLAWDDSEVLGDFAVAPWINLAIETESTSFGRFSGTGLQMGIAPTLYETEDESFALTLPAELGLGLDNYYEDSSGGENTFGYASVGLAASIPLGFMPEGAGDWTLGLSGKYFIFSSTLEDYNDHHGTDPVGMASLNVAF
jgi:hypothetical protein